MQLHRLIAVLRLDAAANVVGGLGLLGVAGWLAPHLGLAATWPVRMAGVLLVVYGIENLLVARAPSTTGVAALVVVDVAFAAGVLALVVADPTGAELWARGLLATAAVASLVFGLVKFAGRRAIAASDTDRARANVGSSTG